MQFNSSTELPQNSKNWENNRNDFPKMKYTLPETNSSHLKMDGWKLEYQFPFLDGLFSGAMLVSGSVVLIGS